MPPQTDELAALRRYRLGCVQAELGAAGLAAALLFDPINIRYATGSRNYQIQQMHMPVRYAFVPAAGRAVLFDLGGWSAEVDPSVVGEQRAATSLSYFFSGPALADRARHWADEVGDLLRAAGGPGCDRLALDRAEPAAFNALLALGVTACDAQPLLEQARLIKSPTEVALMRGDIAVAEAGFARMHAALRPGMTENQLWALLHETNIAAGGEWIDCRLLASGQRTNPWGQECGDKAIEAGELVGFDADMIGPNGLCADVSRTFLCGAGPGLPGRPSAEQRTLYRLAREQVETNIALLRPGLSFRALAERAWPVPEPYRTNAYPEIYHGIGLCDEYPIIPPLHRWAELGYDGEVEAGMTLCVESYIGAEGGTQGVKLEEQVLVTETGCERLSSFPFEADLLA